VYNSAPSVSWLRSASLSKWKATFRMRFRSFQGIPSRKYCTPSKESPKYSISQAWSKKILGYCPESSPDSVNASSQRRSTRARELQQACSTPGIGQLEVNATLPYWRYCPRRVRIWLPCLISTIRGLILSIAYFYIMFWISRGRR
jgi:hypothetical protein